MTMEADGTMRYWLVGSIGAFGLAIIFAPTPRVSAQVGSGEAVAYEVGPSLEQLGRLLFWDPLLSGAKDTACATCHHPDWAYADGRALSLGTGSVGLGPARVDVSNGQVPLVKRNSSTILNTAFNGLDRRGRRGRRDDVPLALTPQPNGPMFWDSRVRSLEEQALEPLKALEEMRGFAYREDEALEVVVGRLRAVPQYVALFEEAFGPGTVIEATHVGQAIAAFERGLLAVDSPYDRFLAGDASAITPVQREGLRVFNRVGCGRCHEGPMFSDYELRAEGVAEHADLPEADVGDGRFRFRTPTLRNAAITAPYMHNGSHDTLENVLQFYDDGQSRTPNVATRRVDGDPRPRVDRRFRGVDDMSDREMAAIIEFLGALTDMNFDR